MNEDAWSLISRVVGLVQVARRIWNLSVNREIEVSEINSQALREAAEQAMHDDWGFDADLFHELVTPSIVLELLDERERNQQYIKRRDQENEDIALTVGKLRVELETAKSKLNEQREYYEGVISDGSKRIAKLESNEVREDGNQFLVVRHPGKTPVIKHCTGDLEEFLRQLIEQDPLVTIDIITHRYYGVGGQWVQDAGEYLHMMSDAGIRIKGE